MPPKKNIDKTASSDKKTPEKKAPRGRVKQIKPPLKSPTVVKLKIPLKERIPKKTEKDVLSRCIKQVKDIRPKQTRMLTAVKKEGREANEVSKNNEKCISLRRIKQVEDIRPKQARMLTAERKVELANEVARAQLVKEAESPAVPTVTPNSTPTTKPAKEKKKRCRRKNETPIVEPVEAPTATAATPMATAATPMATVATRSATVATPMATVATRTATVATRTATVATPTAPVATPSATVATPTANVETPTATVATPTAPIVTDSEEAFDMTPKKRKYVRKQPAELQTKKQNKLTLKRNNVAVAKPQTLSLKKSMRQAKITDLKSGITMTPKQPKDNTKKTAQKIIPMSEPIKRVRRVVTRKGKRASEVTPSDVQNSPLILEPLRSPKKEQTTSPKTDTNVEACAIESRKTSVTGMSECFSWTKDISSSSTTTCVTVCSNEFVRIDKKLPILKLTNIDYELKKALANKKNVLSSSDTESEAIEHTPRTPDRESTSDVESQSLGLSSSSSSSDSLKSQNSVTNNEISEISRALNRLSSKLKNFDLEIINWIGYDNSELNESVKNFQEKIFRVLKEESEVILHCQNIKRVLSDNVVDDVVNDSKKQEDEQITTENGFVVPVNACRNSITEDSDPVNQQSSSPTKPAKEKSSDESENNLTSDRVKYNSSFDHSCDDDDALSLFAESITGIESSRINNNSVASMCNMDAIDYEEYVPQPIKPTREQQKVAYIPSKITDKQNNEVKAKTVCEKQNADSTSIYREIEQDKSLDSVNFENSEQTVQNTGVVEDSRKNKNIVIEKRKRPVLMASLYKSLYGARSIVFKGICFYNLLSSCKNQMCRYPHIVPDNNEITMILVRLSEEVFIQEYMLLRNWPELRRQYGMCFVEECKRRELTKILVEMAIDFIMKANTHNREDIILKVEVLESVLLYLNDVDLETCEDLLLYNIRQGSLLCDVFIQAIANTQNFSRFKPIFINLTNFMVRHGRTFHIDVATQILERLCILPCEQALSEALLLIVKHTNTTIFDNSMMGHFEKQLCSLSADLHAQFLVLKKEAALSRPVVQSIFESVQANPEIEIIRNPTVMHTEREKRYTSPDTTNVDTLKAAEEPIITRTIDFKRASCGNVPRGFSNSNSSTSNDSEEFRASGPILPHPSPSFSNWRGQSVFNNIRRLPPFLPRPPMRPLMKRRTHQNNYGPYPKYPRRSGPDYF